jgi:hypothetical protein
VETFLVEWSPTAFLGQISMISRSSNSGLSIPSKHAKSGHQAGRCSYCPEGAPSQEICS